MIQLLNQTPRVECCVMASVLMITKKTSVVWLNQVICTLFVDHIRLNNVHNPDGICEHLQQQQKNNVWSLTTPIMKLDAISMICNP